MGGWAGAGGSLTPSSLLCQAWTSYKAKISEVSDLLWGGRRGLSCSHSPGKELGGTAEY